MARWVSVSWINLFTPKLENQADVKDTHRRQYEHVHKFDVDVCVCVCVSLSFSCTRSTLWAVQLLFDCAPVFGLSSFCLCVLLFYLFCESLPASLPVVPPDGGEQRGSCRRREVDALEPQQETDLNVFTAGRTYFLLLYTVRALCLCHIQRLCLFIHRATGVPGHMERHS